MPCFKGIAVSIHANGSPLAECGIQKQSKFSRINSFIPVPNPTLSEDSGKTEPAKFAISITLLTPGLPVPYSTPKPTAACPDPSPQYAARDMAMSKAATGVNPYIPMTNSENETVAAYIYFDGRAKEEVATLLRPGEETWVNSRWVQVPEEEGGGLAEREFLFREVGLERWLNGLDLQGHDTQARLEKRRQKFERRRRKQKAGAQQQQQDSAMPSASRDPLRYRNESSILEPSLDDDDDNNNFFDESLSDDSDDEFPEAAGQIKVAMFRVIASGEIKKGEYSPQFGAHDDDDDVDGGASNGVDADVEHTTSFAKPKTLDPKTISTQTVTGIDGPEKPYATFTFYYRGDRQLQKMGVLPSARNQTTTPTAAKRRSGQLDLSNLGPLKTTGTVGFSTFRDKPAETAKRRKSRTGNHGGSSTNKTSNGGAMDEDSEDDDDEPEILGRMEDIDEDDGKDVLGGKTGGGGAPEEAKELTEGVDRIRLKRQRSNEPADTGSNSTPSDSVQQQRSPYHNSGTAATPSTTHSPPISTSGGGFGGLGNIPGLGSASAASGSGSASALGRSLDDAVVGSPMKKQRGGGPLGEFASAQQQQHHTSDSGSLGMGGTQLQASHSAPSVTAAGAFAAAGTAAPSSSMRVEDEEEEL